MIEWRESHPSDFKGFKFKSVFSHEDPAKRAPQALRGQRGVTLFIDGKAVLVAGVHSPWHHVGSIWAWVSEDALKTPLALVKNVKSFIERNAKDLRYRRLDFTVRADYAQGIKFGKVLGFHEEAILYRFGPDGSDYILMTRFF